MVLQQQKGFVQLLLLIILLVGIGIGIYLVSHPQIFTPKANETDRTNQSLCKVSDTASLKNCFSQAQANENISKIEITKQIQCFSKSDCEINLNSRTTPLTIYGTPNTTAGFKRMQNYDYPLLVIGDFSRTNEVSNIILKDLIFDETTTSCDFVKEGIAKCNSPLVLGPKLNNSTVDNVTILHPKAHGIQVGTTKNLTIKNSVIFDAEGNGIWFDSGYPAGCQVDFNNFTPCAIDDEKISKYVTIENNLIADSKIAAIEFYAQGSAEMRNSIKGNLITRNHRDSKYTACPPPAGHCPGGQLVIARSNFVTVEENIIRDGIIDSIDPKTGNTFHSRGLLTTGIELSDSIQDIMIKNNRILNNTGAAIFADYIGPQYKVENIGIFWNVVNGNSMTFAGVEKPSLNGAYGFGIESNIVNDQSYPDAFPKAFLFNDPPVCVPSSGDKCETTVRWYSNFYKELKISVLENQGALFAKALNGAQKAPWISTNGATFTLEILQSDSNSPLRFILDEAYSIASKNQ